MFYDMMARYHRDTESFAKDYQSVCDAEVESATSVTADEPSENAKEISLYDCVCTKCTCGKCYQAFVRHDRVPWHSNQGTNVFINAKHGTHIVDNCPVAEWTGVGYIYQSLKEFKTQRNYYGLYDIQTSSTKCVDRVREEVRQKNETLTYQISDLQRHGVDWKDELAALHLQREAALMSYEATVANEVQKLMTTCRSHLKFTKKRGCHIPFRKAMFKELNTTPTERKTFTLDLEPLLVDQFKRGPPDDERGPVQFPDEDLTAQAMRIADPFKFVFDSRIAALELSLNGTAHQ